MTKEEQSQLILKMATELMGNRTCENYRFLVDGSCTLGIRHFEIDTNPEDFGCNKFTRKEK